MPPTVVTRGMTAAIADEPQPQPVPEPVFGPRVASLPSS